MTEQSQPQPAIQVVTLDDPKSSVLVADGPNGTRVFYDLDHLFDQYAPKVLAHAAIAQATGDERRIGQAHGEVMLLEGIRQSVEALRLEADFRRS